MTATAASPAPPPLLVAAAAATLGVPLATAGVVSIADPPAPVGPGLGVAAAVVAVGLTGFLLLRGASMPGGVLLLRWLTRCSLGLSLIAVIATLTVLTQGIGPGAVLADLAAHAWVMAVLLLIAAPARTVGWSALAGTAICGFLGVVAAARVVGVPVVSALGVDDVVATSVWVPVTEEVLKALPVALIAVVAVGIRKQRLAAVDFGLLGVACGAGFAIAENARFGRAFADWTALPPVTVLLPTVDPVDGGLPVVAGHAVWTGLVGLAIGWSVLLGSRFRVAWLAAPAALGVVVVEHGVTNLTDPPPLLLVPVAGGLLSSVLLVVGFAVSAVIQRRRPLGRAALLAGLGIRTGASR